MNKTEFKTLEELIEYYGGKNPLYQKFEIKPGTRMEKTKQENVLDCVRAGCFIIGSVDASGIVSFAAAPMAHTDATTARAEAKRLATQNPGKAFIFVKLAGAEMVPAQRAVSI